MKFFSKFDNAHYIENKEAISVGSKTFRLASFFFSRTQREEAYILYVWCRTCDDLIDEASEGDDLNSILETLRENTLNAIKGEITHKVFIDQFGKLIRKRQIPQVYAEELLEGMRMDIGATNYPNLLDLKLYCYRVAGVVGLMMCHIMGIYNEKSLESAVKLGIAMQLTNICRDLAEDALQGRCYLPRDMLLKTGLDFPRVDTDEKKNELFILVKSLLSEAEKNYEAGWNGIPDLPLRPGVTIAVALELYRGIGRKIIRLGPNALSQRVWLSKSEKSLVVFQALCRFFFKTRWWKNYRKWNQNPHQINSVYFFNDV